MKSSLASVEARDPQTSVQRLYEIAASSPELHADLLLNPACTEALRSWILQAGPLTQANAQSTEQATEQTSPHPSVPAAEQPTASPLPERPGGSASPSTLEMPTVSGAVRPTDGMTSELTPVRAQPPTETDLPAVLPPPVPPASAQTGQSVGGPPGDVPAGPGAASVPAAPGEGQAQPAVLQRVASQRVAWVVGAVVLALVLVLGVRSLVGAGGSSQADGPDGAATASAVPGADQPGTSGPSPQVTALAPSPAPSSKYSGTKLRPAPADALPARLIDTQTQNIYCQISDERAACSIRERYYRAAGAPDCDGDLFSITVVDGAPRLACGESFLGAAGQTPQRLAPQQYAASENFACLVETTGVSCWNQWTGHGFKVARAAYQTF